MDTHTNSLTLLDIVHRSQPLVPWAEGDNVPWDDPIFSERMLAEHLSQDHDHASRTESRIDGHVAWIWNEVLNARSTSVLDLACGPGLYTRRLATRGCRCVGIDFAPAAVRYARTSAAAEKLDCTYERKDLRSAELGTAFGLIMMLSGQLNVFRREEAADLLVRAHRALSAEGQVLLEVQTYEHVRGDGETRCTWNSVPEGIFSADPHLLVQESAWDEDAGTRTDRFFVVDAGTGGVVRHAMSTEAYTRQQLGGLLERTGFGDLRFCESLTGDADPTYPFNLVVTARKKN